jgi:outer membrane receptor protein involved in Fe transport
MKNSREKKLRSLNTFIMRKINLPFILFFLSIFYSSIINAQNVRITGTVKNSTTQEVMPLVTVHIKGTTSSSLTDDNGNFRIISEKGLPVTLVFTSASFEEYEIIVTDDKAEVQALMTPKIFMENPVVIGATRIPTKLMDAPVSIEQYSAKKIMNAAALDYYSLASTLKGTDLITSGVLFKTISTRGFNSSGSYRVNQLVDGMDNMLPGLNFFIGNFLGLTEMDVASMELLPGASSALYGSGGMNGTVLINSKNPFRSTGLSIQMKQGIMNTGNQHREQSNAYSDYSIRWAKSFNDKFAFKITAQYIIAKDWLADDSSNYFRKGNSGNIVPGNRQTDPNYDGVNVYGDETTVDIRPFMQGAIQANPGLTPILQPFLGSPQMVSRTGYAEKELIDPKTTNLKFSGALHYKISEKLEAQLMGYWATGNTVYTGDNRYAFKNIKLGQYKAELRHKYWFIRTYTTQEDAGEAHSVSITTQYLNEAWKPSYNPANVNGSWYPQYTGAFTTGAVQVFQSVLAGGGSLSQAQAAVVNAAPQLHTAGRGYADQGRPAAGSSQFTQLFDQIRKVPIPNGGLFLEKSQLWMTEGQYNFSDKIKFAEVIVGVSWRRYILNSDGTLFIDTLKPITINEGAAYAQVTKKLFSEKLILAVSGRYDKNDDFKGRFTPRATALIKLGKHDNLRLSYQTAYRFPATQDKYIRLDVGTHTLLGGLPWVMDYMNAKTHPVVEVINGVPASTPYVYKEMNPESVNSFEVGYKTLIANKLLIDAYGYFGQYKGFLGRNTLYQPSTGETFSTWVNSIEKIKTHGFGLGFDYNLPADYNVFLNFYSDVLSNVPDGFRAYFNTPKYRLNTGVSNSSLGKNKNYGFNVVLHWQDAFYWEGDFANGPINAYSAIDAQVNYKFLEKKSMMVKLGGNNILNHYYKSGFAHPYVGAIYYISILYTPF